MCAKLCFMNWFCHKQLRETGSRSPIWVFVSGQNNDVNKMAAIQTMNYTYFFTDKSCRRYHCFFKIAFNTCRFTETIQLAANVKSIHTIYVILGLDGFFLSLTRGRWCFII